MYKLNPGLVSAIRRGKRQASRRVLNVLGIIYYEEAAAPVCREHGIAHGIQHKHKPTFDENAAEYESWKAANAAELARRVMWSEVDKLARVFRETSDATSALTIRIKEAQESHER